MVRPSVDEGRHETARSHQCEEANVQLGHSGDIWSERGDAKMQNEKPLAAPGRVIALHKDLN